MSEAILDALQRRSDAIGRADLTRRRGRVSNLIGLIVEASGLEAEVGEVCEVAIGRDPMTGEERTISAEVVGFKLGRTLLMPLGEMHGIGPGNVVTATGRRVSVHVGPQLLGRVIDGLGNPVDGKGPLDALPTRPITGQPPSPLERPRITDRVTLGVRALDSIIPCGRG
ncbi:MAG TPA: hypothetical protein PKB03_01330, partial [Baekduia sp.]|nr:hypothetical protein [Baekduia sp.]